MPLISYTHVVKKLFEITVQLLTSVTNHEVDNFGPNMQNQNILTFLHLFLNLNLSNANLIFPVDIEQSQTVNILKF